jgi:hypothetical protein
MITWALNVKEERNVSARPSCQPSQAPQMLGMQPRENFCFLFSVFHGSTRAGGLSYLGGATKGGLGRQAENPLEAINISTRHFKCRNGCWLNHCLASYADQLDALKVTYEDWEDEYDSPYGVAKTSEVFLFSFRIAPESDPLPTLTEHINSLPVFIADRDHIARSEALGTYWQSPKVASQTIENHLNFLTKFYQGRVSQRKWYGFWDHGDVIHIYGVDHQRRYGKAFGKLNLHQVHSRLTAYAANRLNNSTLAARAWNEFYNTDGFEADAPWNTERVEGSKVLLPVDEAAWVSTNDAGQYGLAAIENLALIGEYLP